VHDTTADRRGLGEARRGEARRRRVKRARSRGGRAARERAREREREGEGERERGRWMGDGWDGRLWAGAANDGAVAWLAGRPSAWVAPLGRLGWGDGGIHGQWNMPAARLGMRLARSISCVLWQATRHPMDTRRPGFRPIPPPAAPGYYVLS